MASVPVSAMPLTSTALPVPTFLAPVPLKTAVWLKLTLSPLISPPRVPLTGAAVVPS